MTRQPPASSRHLDSIADRVSSGAHVVLRGHLRDDVLVEGRPVEELWGLADALARRAGIERVFVANRADGLYCFDASEEEEAAGFFRDLAEETGVPAAALNDSTPTTVATATRMLMRQRTHPVAIVFEDAGELLGGPSEQAGRALGLVAQAMVEATFVNRPRGDRVRNAIIVYGSPGGPAMERLAGTPGVSEEVVETPDTRERLACIRYLSSTFFRGRNGKPSDLDLECLANLTEGFSIRELGQLSHGSHAFEIPASRPQALVRRARQESTETPIGELGVELIMKRLKAEIFGQTETLDAVKQKLVLGQWRPAAGAAGARTTRPMATMLLHGPAGVGKTETALILAESLLGSREAIVRIDCAEMQNAHETARLIGAPPGYVGYEEGGALTEALEHDAAVILLDEFDRGPAELGEMLLGILDAGRLTDGRGRTATFENAILLLTTNLGFRAGESKIRPEDPPTPTALLSRSREKVEFALRGGNDGGLGSEALWSRLKGSLIGYDILRDSARDHMVRHACEHLERNLEDELERRLDIDHEAFVELIASRLPYGFDGRAVSLEIQTTIETPLRQWLRGNPPPRRRRREVFGPAEAELFYAANS